MQLDTYGLMAHNGQPHLSTTFFVSYLRSIFFVLAFLCARHDRVLLLNVLYCNVCPDNEQIILRFETSLLNDVHTTT